MAATRLRVADHDDRTGICKSVIPVYWFYLHL
jgi:hypothetical protein